MRMTSLDFDEMVVTWWSREGRELIEMALSNECVSLSSLVSEEGEETSGQEAGATEMIESRKFTVCRPGVGLGGAWKDCHMTALGSLKIMDCHQS